MFAGAVSDIPSQIVALQSPKTAVLNGDSTNEEYAPGSPDSTVPYGNIIEEYLELLLDKALETPGKKSPEEFSNEKAFARDATGRIPRLAADSVGEVGSVGRKEAVGTGSAGTSDARGEISLPGPRRASAYANGRVRETVLLVWRTYLIQLRTPELFAVRLALVSSTDPSL